MTVLATDNFNRANANPIGAPWATVASSTPFQIVSNVATPTDVATTDDNSIYTGITWPPDQYCKAKLSVVSTAGSDQGVGLIVRGATGARTLYRLITDHAATNNVEIQKFNAGVFSVLTGFPVTQAWSDGDTWEIRAIGTSISIYRNGVQVGPTATDTLIASGSPGIALSTAVTSASIDDWEGGDTSTLLAQPQMALQQRMR